MEFKQYPNYKDSGVEWLGEVPEHWEIMQLKSAIKNWRNGKWGNDVGTNKNDNLICVRVADFNRDKGVIDTEKLTYRNYTGETIGSCLLNKNHILIERSGGGENQLVGATVRFTLSEISVCSNFISLLEIKTENFDLRFIQYSFEHLYNLNVNKLSIKQTSGIQNLDLKQYVQNSFSFPHLLEQQKIVSYLDSETTRIDNLIAKQEKLIELLEEQRKSIISHAVTKGLNPDAPMKDSGVEWLGEVPEHWMTPSSKHLLDMPITDGPHETPNFVDEGIPFISAEAISKGKIDFDKKRGYITSETNDIYSKKYTPKIEDIYMVKSGATTGKVAIVETIEMFNIWSPLAVFRCDKSKILPKFLLSVFNSSHFYDALVLNWSYGTQQNIGMGVLSNIEIPCPPMNEQQVITQYLDHENAKFDALVDTQNKLIQKLKEYRSSIISHAVTGKIDVREIAV